MSVRYSGTAVLDEAAVREIERAPRTAHWNDKIEVRLDNRQVFFLFFGSAVVACMLFVLGVIVGKRIESRGRAAAPEIQDPLAVLDRVAQRPATAGELVPAAPAVELTFPKTLIAPAPAPVRPRPSPAQLAPIAPPKPLAAKVAPPARPVLALKPVAAKPPAAAPVDPAKASKGKYTLHLATLQTKEEADALAKKYPGAFVISGDVPGKGLVYRVRFGNYGSYQDATAAKTSFEKQNRAIALIAAR